MKCFTLTLDAQKRTQDLEHQGWRINNKPYSGVTADNIRDFIFTQNRHGVPSLITPSVQCQSFHAIDICDTETADQIADIIGQTLQPTVTITAAQRKTLINAIRRNTDQTNAALHDLKQLNRPLNDLIQGKSIIQVLKQELSLTELSLTMQQETALTKLLSQKNMHNQRMRLINETHMWVQAMTYVFSEKNDQIFCLQFKTKITSWVGSEHKKQAPTNLSWQLLDLSKKHVIEANEAKLLAAIHAAHQDDFDEPSLLKINQHTAQEFKTLFEGLFKRGDSQTIENPHNFNNDGWAQWAEKNIQKLPKGQENGDQIEYVEPKEAWSESLNIEIKRRPILMVISNCLLLLSGLSFICLIDNLFNPSLTWIQTALFYNTKSLIILSRIDIFLFIFFLYIVIETYHYYLQSNDVPEKFDLFSHIFPKIPLVLRTSVKRILTQPCYQAYIHFKVFFAHFYYDKDPTTQDAINQVDDLLGVQLSTLEGQEGSVISTKPTLMTQYTHQLEAHNIVNKYDLMLCDQQPSQVFDSAQLIRNRAEAKRIIKRDVQRVLHLNHNMLKLITHKSLFDHLNSEDYAVIATKKNLHAHPHRFADWYDLFDLHGREIFGDEGEDYVQRIKAQLAARIQQERAWLTIDPTILECKKTTQLIIANVIANLPQNIKDHQSEKTISKIQRFWRSRRARKQYQKILSIKQALTSILENNTFQNTDDMCTAVMDALRPYDPNHLINQHKISQVVMTRYLERRKAALIDQYFQLLRRVNQIRSKINHAEQEKTPCTIGFSCSLFLIFILEICSKSIFKSSLNMIGLQNPSIICAIKNILPIYNHYWFLFVLTMIACYTLYRLMLPTIEGYNQQWSDIQKDIAKEESDLLNKGEALIKECDPDIIQIADDITRNTIEIFSKAQLLIPAQALTFYNTMFSWLTGQTQPTKVLDQLLKHWKLHAVSSTLFSPKVNLFGEHRLGGAQISPMPLHHTLIGLVPPPNLR